MTICVKCGSEKSDDDFYYNKTAKVKDKTCKACRIKVSKAKSAAKSPDERRAHNLQMRYGISVGEYHEMLDKQEGGCAICHRTDTLCVDHDHNTGAVRGILCIRCNSAIAYMNEMQGITNAFNYLLPHISSEDASILKAGINTAINEFHCSNS